MDCKTGWRNGSEILTDLKNMIFKNFNSQPPPNKYLFVFFLFLKQIYQDSKFCLNSWTFNVWSIYHHWLPSHIYNLWPLLSVCHFGLRQVSVNFISVNICQVSIIFGLYKVYVIFALCQMSVTLHQVSIIILGLCQVFINFCQVSVIFAFCQMFINFLSSIYNNSLSLLLSVKCLQTFIIYP